MFYRCWTLTSYELITILDFFQFCVSVYFSRFQRSIPLVIKSYLAKYSIYQVLILDVGLMPYNVCRSLILVVCFQGSMPAHKKRSHEVLVSGQATPGVTGFGRKAFSDVTNVFFTPRDKENAQKKPRTVEISEREVATLTFTPIDARLRLRQCDRKTPESSPETAVSFQKCPNWGTVIRGANGAECSGYLLSSQTACAVSCRVFLFHSFFILWMICCFCVCGTYY